ncbi:MAG: 6-bladed beta-propeller [Muribaculaceae bacterium]|nr:6-bladed beta-propeller [Muribaculaceae bacterium]
MKSKLQIVYCFETMAILFSILTCTRREYDPASKIIFPEITLCDFENTPVPLSSLLMDYKLIPLETSEECLISADHSHKIIKKDGHFFVKSINEILMFDDTGHYEGKLSKCGDGPQEYHNISDFDIVPQSKEIWISSQKEIVRYNYPSMEFCGRHPLPFYANKFKSIDNNLFIALTPEDKTYKIISLDGTVLQDYFDKDLANSLENIVHFLKIDEKIVASLGGSNSAVSYDLETKSFSVDNILSSSNDQLSTLEINRKYYELYGYFDFYQKVSQDYVEIISFRKIGDQVIMLISYPGEIEENYNMALVLCHGNSVKIYKIWPKNDTLIVDDVTKSDDTSFLLTFGSCESCESIVFIIDGEEYDNNPVLLEVRKLKL